MDSFRNVEQENQRATDRAETDEQGNLQSVEEQRIRDNEICNARLAARDAELKKLQEENEKLKEFLQKQELDKRKNELNMENALQHFENEVLSRTVRKFNVRKDLEHEFVLIVKRKSDIKNCECGQRVLRGVEVSFVKKEKQCRMLAIRAQTRYVKRRLEELKSINPDMHIILRKFVPDPVNSLHLNSLPEEYIGDRDCRIISATSLCRMFSSMTNVNNRLFVKIGVHLDVAFDIHFENNNNDDFFIKLWKNSQSRSLMRYLKTGRCSSSNQQSY